MNFQENIRGETEESNLTESRVKILKKSPQCKRNANDMREENKRIYFFFS